MENKKKKTQEELFNFMNKNKIKYIVTRGADEESKKEGKDLDILLDKKDYEKFKNKFPETDRILDFYFNEEKRLGIVIIPYGAFSRRVFDKEKGFYVLSEKDYKRMDFFRRGIHVVRKVKRFFGMYDKGYKESEDDIKLKRNKLKITKRNIRMFGVGYVFWDMLYQASRIMHNKTSEKKSSKKVEIVKRKVHDYEMFIDKNGRGIHRDLYFRGVREPVSTKIVQSLLKEGDVALEAGANIGYYSILESKKVGRKGMVYAIEPIKENFDLLNKNIKLNKLKNVKTFEFGLSDSNKKIKIYIGSDNNANSPIKADPSSISREIKTTTLDSFFKGKRKPNFMRMDIEGYEDVVFKGGEKTLEDLDIIFVELHFPLIKKDKMANLLKKFKEKGFGIYKGVLEWERMQEEDNWLGKFVNYCYKKRSKPVIYNSKDLTIDKLLNSKDFLEGHLSLEVFFVKRNKLKQLNTIKIK